MKRDIVRIDPDKCNGCGLCASACKEGAIEIVAGKARLTSDVYCDGLGACLGECPQGAITIERREAAAFDEAAVERRLHQKRAAPLPCGCPGTMMREMKRAEPAPASPCCDGAAPARSELRNWPVQLKLVSPLAPYLKGADLLLAADCVAFALPDFHARFLRDRPVVIGCPKLDDAQYYVEKLASILKEAKVRSLTVVHMEVPCCSGLSRIAQAAVKAAGVAVSIEDVTIGIEGGVIESVAV